MSYDIIIGEAVIQDREDEALRVAVELRSNPDAPLFPYDEMTGQGNGRYPSYSGWEEFTKAVGLHDLFLDEETGLMRNHPGCCRLTTAHHEQIVAALAAYRAAHPDTGPGWDWNSWATLPDDGVRGRDYLLARLIWLEYWVGWALRTCTLPAIYNR